MIEAIVDLVMAVAFLLFIFVGAACVIVVSMWDITRTKALAHLYETRAKLLERDLNSPSVDTKEV